MLIDLSSHDNNGDTNKEACLRARLELFTVILDQILWGFNRLWILDHLFFYKPSCLHFLLEMKLVGALLLD
jgi:hypothetical protein